MSVLVMTSLIGFTIRLKCRISWIQKVRHLSIRGPSNCKPSSGLSYFSCASDEPLLGRTIGDVLDDTVDASGDKLAFVVSHQNLRKTYAEFQFDVDKLATGLLAVGLKKGDLVGVWGPNTYEWIVSQFALAKTGIILVTVNPAYRPPELLYSINKVGLKGLIMADTFKTQNFYEILLSLAPSLSSSKAGELNESSIPSLSHVIMMSGKRCGGSFRFEEILQAGGTLERQNLQELKTLLQFDDPINIQFTSGTTGNPKGATLTHHNLVNNAYFVAKRRGFFEKPHRICNMTPLYHCSGCVLGTLASVISANCLIFPYFNFNAEAVMKAVQEEKATSLGGTPTMFVDILNHPDFEKYDLSSVETGMIGGAPCAENLIRIVSRKIVKQLQGVFGSTELSPVSVMTFRSDSEDIRATTCGKLLPHVEVKVVDDLGNIVPIGAQGEFWTRGFHVMLGYYNDQKKTEESITKDGWYKSGDMVTMDAEGNVKAIGRKTDMVIRGGENIYPREIEDCLHTHDKIADAQVVGVPDKRMGEELCAWIRIKEGETLKEEEVKMFLKDKISYFKIPRYILFVDDFPMTVTRKVQKFTMQKESIKKLNISV